MLVQNAVFANMDCLDAALRRNRLIVSRTNSDVDDLPAGSLVAIRASEPERVIAALGGRPLGVVVGACIATLTPTPAQLCRQIEVEIDTADS